MRTTHILLESLELTTIKLTSTSPTSQSTAASPHSNLSPTTTALHLAASNGHTAIVMLLLQNGAQINAMDERGRTALHCAGEAGHIDVVRLLLGQSGVHVNLGLWGDHDIARSS
jgi:ankyrin repeat protein